MLLFCVGNLALFRVEGRMYLPTKQCCIYFVVKLYSVKHGVVKRCFPEGSAWGDGRCWGEGRCVLGVGSVTQHHTGDTVPYCTVLYCTVLYCTVLYCTVLYFTVLYCTVLYCTVLYCTVLYYTVLYWEEVGSQCSLAPHLFPAAPSPAAQTCSLYCNVTE